MKEVLEKRKIEIALGSIVIVAVLFVVSATYFFSLRNSQIKQIALSNQEIKDIDPRPFEALSLQAKAFAVYDGDKKKVIYAKNGLSQLPIASLTKIMSTVVALDSASRDTIIDIRPDGELANKNDRYALIPGKWKLGDLLKLTLVASSNGGINTISDQLASLVGPMNKKAKALGLNQTYFLNESGLDINASLAGAYSSAIDIAKLFDFAEATEPDIFNATKYNSIAINSVDGKTLEVQNTNKNVSEIDGLLASKTGLTDLAGGNLALIFKTSSGRRIVVVVLGSTESGRFTDAAELVAVTKNVI